jgi:hypothetical protein
MSMLAIKILQQRCSAAILIAELLFLAARK